MFFPGIKNNSAWCVFSRPAGGGAPRPCLRPLGLEGGVGPCATLCDRVGGKSRPRAPPEVPRAPPPFPHPGLQSVLQVCNSSARCNRRPRLELPTAPIARRGAEPNRARVGVLAPPLGNARRASRWGAPQAAGGAGSPAAWCESHAQEQRGQGLRKRKQRDYGRDRRRGMSGRRRRMPGWRLLIGLTGILYQVKGWKLKCCNCLVQQN